MNTKSPSSLLFDFLKETIEQTKDENAALFGIEVLDSVYQEMKLDKGIVVSNSEWDFAPLSTETDVFDALIIMGFYVRINGKDTSERAEQRDVCFQMAKAVADKLFEDNQDLNGRVCKGFLLLRAVDGNRNTTSDEYAIINLPIILNPSGARIDYSLGEAK